MDELNEYLECTCGRCDDGICRRSDFVNEPLQDTNYDDLDYDYEEEEEDDDGYMIWRTKMPIK